VKESSKRVVVPGRLSPAEVFLILMLVEATVVVGRLPSLVGVFLAFGLYFIWKFDTGWEETFPPPKWTP